MLRVRRRIMIPCWTTCFTPTAGHRPFPGSRCHNRGIRWDKPGLGISLSGTSLWRTTRKLDKIHKHSHFGMLSASTPASIPLNLRGTVITINVGATEESAREDKGDERDSGCRSWSQMLFIKPTPPPTHTHTHTHTHTQTLQHTLEHANTHMPISCNMMLLKSLCRIKRQRPDCIHNYSNFSRFSSNLILISMCQHFLLLSFSPHSKY